MKIKFKIHKHKSKSKYNLNKLLNKIKKNNPLKGKLKIKYKIEF